MVDSVGSTGAANNSTLLGGSKGAVTDQIGFDTYLKLLVVQLKNQDPLNPMDGKEFTKELATFSQLEQQIQSNDFLEQLTKTQDYGRQGLANSYLGKAALVPGNSLTYAGEGEVEFGYSLEKPAGKVQIDIIANDGSGVVRTIYADGTAGNHVLKWDGKNDAKEVMEEGTYTVRVKATDTEGTVIPSQAYTYGIVTAVTGAGGTVEVELHDGRRTDVDDVLMVRLVAA